MSNVLTAIDFNPNRDQVEDRPRMTKFNTKQLEVVAAKVMLAFYAVSNLINIEQVIFFYRYPRLSEFFRIFLLFFVLIFDPSHLLSYLLFMFLVIFIVMNDGWYGKVKPIFDWFFHLNELNPYINDQEADKIKTVR